LFSLWKTDKQCDSFVKNVLKIYRPAMRPEYTHRELIARDKGTDRSDDLYNSNVKYNPHNNSRNSAKRKREYREANEARIRANPEIR